MNPRKWRKKLIFHKFPHPKMTILLYKIENFSKWSFSCPLCMIEHDIDSTQERDEKSYIGFYIKKWRLYYTKLNIFQNFPFFTLLHDWAWLHVNLRKQWKKLIFHKFLHQKMAILLYEIENFSKFSLFLPFCMIEHDYMSI